MKKAYIYVKEIFKNSGVTFERILNSYYRFDKLDSSLPDAIFLAKLKQTKDISKLKEVYQTQQADEEYDVTLVDIELVTVSMSKYIKGEYFAHEYDVYAPGKQRRLIYSNGFTEYETKCLNPKLSVMDGIWEEERGNGCGDYFEAFEAFPAVKVTPRALTPQKGGR